MKINVTKENNYNIHTVENDNFRDCHFSLSFTCDFEPKKYVAYNLLCDILTEQSIKYKSSKYITRFMQENFIISFYGSCQKIGKAIQTSIICDYVDPRYIDEKDYLDKIYSFIFETISNPNIINDGFDENNFNLCKSRLINYIVSLDGSRNFISLSRAMKLYSKDDYISFHLHDSKDFIESITKEELYNYYKELIGNSSVDVFVSGSSKHTTIKKLVNKYFSLKPGKYRKHSELVYGKKHKIVRKKSGKSKYNQSSIVMIYTIDNPTMYEREFVAPYYTNILASAGLTSKLHQSLREKNHLCYGVDASIFDRENLLVVKSSVNIESEKKAIKLIKKSVKEMSYLISNKEFTGALYSQRSSLKSVNDSLASILRIYLNQYFGGFSSYEDKLKKYDKVKIKDIYNFAKKIKLDTIYVLKGDVNERDEN